MSTLRVLRAQEMASFYYFFIFFIHLLGRRSRARVRVREQLMPLAQFCLSLEDTA